MTQEDKNKWIEALKSGEYRQGTDGLHIEDSYCCLGVLCDISKKGGWSKDVDGKYVYKDSSNGGYLPRAIAEDFDITLKGHIFYDSLTEPLQIKFRDNKERILGTEKSVVSLAVINDSEKLSFVKIAEIIETAEFVDYKSFIC